MPRGMAKRLYLKLWEWGQVGSSLWTTPFRLSHCYLKNIDYISFKSYVHATVTEVSRGLFSVYFWSDSKADDFYWICKVFVNLFLSVGNPVQRVKEVYSRRRLCWSLNRWSIHTQCNTCNSKEKWKIKQLSCSLSSRQYHPAPKSLICCSLLGHQESQSHSLITTACGVSKHLVNCRTAFHISSVWYTQGFRYLVKAPLEHGYCTHRSIKHGKTLRRPLRSDSSFQMSVHNKAAVGDLYSCWLCQKMFWW